MKAVAPDYNSDMSAREIVRLDEEFHLRLAALSQNMELGAHPRKHQ